MRTYLFLLTMLFLATSTSTVYAMTVYVPDDFDTIQAGIDACTDGDTVIVRDGTYTGEGNRDINFTGKAIVLMSENGPEVTIIDCEGDSLNQHRGFYFHLAEDLTSVLQGFTIRDGFAEDGGGIYCDSSSPLIANCIFTNNRVYGTTYWDDGGGIYLSSSSPMITNCIFSGNMAGAGGAIYLSSGCYPTIRSCTFTQNSGGGIHSFSSPTVTNCVFTANSGGGMYNDGHWHNPTISNCLFARNSGSGIGTAEYNDLTITNCTFTQNSSYAIHNWEGYPTLINCILWRNISGEIYNYMGIVTVSYSDVQGGYSGTGNIDADPLFMTYKGIDYLLNVGSPCIDTGDPAIEDLISDWHPSWPDWLPNGPRSDMGAYGGPGNKGWLQ